MKVPLLAFKQRPGNPMCFSHSLSSSSVCFISVYKKNTTHPGTTEQLSCCLVLHEEGLSKQDLFALDVSELDVPECLYPTIYF